jgi:hypothetical protein
VDHDVEVVAGAVDVLAEVPGSDSSALTTRYFGLGLSCGMNDHFMPVGKPAPPRPRRPESLTAVTIASGAMPSAVLRAP